MEPVCAFCGIGDKQRCKTLEQATKCSNYFEANEEKAGIDFEFDFGFSEPIDVTELTETNNEKNKVIENLKIENKDLDNRLHSLYNTIIPFLERIEKGGEKDIHWPNRAKQIASFKTKLTNIVEGKK